MWLRFFLISLARWVVDIVLVGFLLRLVIPDTWSGLATAVPIWVVSFLLAFAIAEWAFRRHIPTKHDIALLIVLWLVVGYALDILLAYFLIGSALVVAKSTDRHMTYLFEIGAILLAAYVTRRRKLKETLGEGMEM